MEPGKAFHRLCDRLVDRFKASGAVLGLSDNNKPASTVENISKKESTLVNHNKYLMKRITDLEAARCQLLG
jgi:hypothetical protein